MDKTYNMHTRTCARTCMNIPQWEQKGLWSRIIIAAHCDTLQHKLQQTVNIPQLKLTKARDYTQHWCAWCSVHVQCVAVRYSALQCVAVCGSVLRCVAVCCSVLQCVAVCGSVLQCAAVCCSALQCVAVCTAVRIERALITHDIVALNALRHHHYVRQGESSASLQP